MKSRDLAGFGWVLLLVMLGPLSHCGGVGQGHAWAVGLPQENGDEGEPAAGAKSPANNLNAGGLNSEPPFSQEIVEQLIQRLAHPQYSVRQRSRYALEVLGLRAVDALRTAQDSPNVEIASAAKSILSGLQVRWVDEADPIEVRQILDNYGDLQTSERANRLDRLARVSGSKGVDALIRVVRYEQSLGLSRYAAALIIQPQEIDPSRSREDYDRWEVALGDSPRTAAQWLRLWLQDQRQETVDGDTWGRFLRDQKDLAIAATASASANTSDSDVEILVRFYQSVAGHAAKSGFRELAMQLAIEGFQGLPVNRRNLLMNVTWALDMHLDELVVQLYRQQQQLFAGEPELLYSLAEAQLDLNEAQSAEETRLTALRLNPLPPLSEDEAEQSKNADQVRRLSMRRRELARRLVDRGLFQWAEDEHRYVLENTVVNSIESAIHRSDLVDLFSMLDQHAEAVEILGPLVDRLNKDAVFKERVRKEVWIGADELASELEYHRSFTLDDTEAAKQSLRLALSKRRDNPDIVIAMYGIAGDAAWREEVEEEVMSQSKLFANEVRRGEEAVRRDPSSEVGLRLARACNNFAWLVCSTDGDLAQAIRWSQRSLELEPTRAEYFDTLAACYARQGDLDQAIRLQRQAVFLSPHYPPLRTQLDAYEARAERGSDGQPERDAGS